MESYSLLYSPRVTPFKKVIRLTIQVDGPENRHEKNVLEPDSTLGYILLIQDYVFIPRRSLSINLFIEVLTK